jgi:Flp pilus assembly protein TadD
MKRAGPPSRFRPRRWIIVLVVLAILIPGGYYLARHVGWPAYKEWRTARLQRMAKDFMAAGDYDNALLTARRALRENRRSLDHWKIAAAAAKAMGQPDAIYYQQNVARIDKTLASRIELIRLALLHGDFHDAIDAIENADESAKHSAQFHELAAEVYTRIGRSVPAKLHLYSLLSLQPDDKKARLDLAALELADDTGRKNRQIRETLLELSREPGLRVRALSLLLRDAIDAGDRATAEKFADQLRTESKLTPEQKVLVFAGLVFGAPERAADYKRELESEFRNDADGVVALAHYYRKGGRRAEAQHWFDSLPREILTNPQVEEAIATDYLEWQDWARLDQALATQQWKGRDFMRHAYAAYSARRNGRTAEAGSEWRLAVIQAGDDVHQTSELLTLVGRWGWQTEQYDLVWKLFALMPRNQEVTNQLVAWERFQGHTANLNRIFGKLAEFSSDDPMITNNFAYTSLLLNANLSKAFEMARSNYEAEPKNPFYVTTEAFALYKQNKPADALVLLEKLDAPALSAPERTLFHALFLAATGEADRAADLLSGLKSKGLLPEERHLAEVATNQVAALERERGQDLRLVALSHRGEIDRSKGWLEALPEKVRATATEGMKTADSLFAIGDMTGLGAQLRKGTWDRHDYLRMALIAYAARARGDNAQARSYWGTALGAAAGDQERLRNLETLATRWNWQAEKMDVLTRQFQLDSDNRDTFTQLMNYYRAAGRTAELVSVLAAYLSSHPDDEAQRSELAYYRMLSGVDLSRAYVAAQSAYEAAPGDASRRMVYAFSLWKQHRAKEAWGLLEDLPDHNSGNVVPLALLRAAVLSDLERRDDAAQALKQFDAKRALPEEATLATVLASRLKSDRQVSQL